MTHKYRKLDIERNYHYPGGHPMARWSNIFLTKATGPYCADCCRRMGESCDLLGKITEKVVGDCRLVGYRQLRPRPGPARRHSASTGDWAVVLEKR